MTTSNQDERVSNTHPDWFFSIRQRLGNPKLKLVLMGLLAIDLVFLGCHLLNTYGLALVDPMWNLGIDRSFSEWFQYAKYVGIILSLSSLALRSRSLLFASFAILFSWVLLDDSLALHESLGIQLGTALNTDNNKGELIALAGMGLLAAMPLLVTFLRTQNTDEKSFSIDIVKLLIVFAILGVAIDYIDSEIYFSTRFLQYLFGTLEDFGENVVGSIILALSLGALNLYRNPQQPLE